MGHVLLIVAGYVIGNLCYLLWWERIEAACDGIARWWAGPPPPEPPRTGPPRSIDAITGLSETKRGGPR